MPDLIREYEAESLLVAEGYRRNDVRSAISTYVHDHDISAEEEIYDLPDEWWLSPGEVDAIRERLRSDS